MISYILCASVIVIGLRIGPIFIKSFSFLKTHPQLVRYLEFMIAMITGEVLYNLAFQDMPHAKVPNGQWLTVLSLTALFVAAWCMVKTKSLTKSFLFSLLFFILTLTGFYYFK